MSGEQDEGFGLLRAFAGASFGIAGAGDRRTEDAFGGVHTGARALAACMAPDSAGGYDGRDCEELSGAAIADPRRGAKAAADALPVAATRVAGAGGVQSWVLG